MDPELTKEETQFFESGGQSGLPEETPAAETPAAETSAETPVATQAKETETEKDKLVPIETLKEARGVNRELRAQLAQAEAARQQMEKRFTELMERLAPAKEKPPSFDENPAENLRSEVTQLKEELTTVKTQTQQEKQDAQFVSWYQGQAAEFAKTQPDFGAAYADFIGKRHDELANLGLGEPQINQRILAEERHVVATAAQMGLNPAQLMFQLAQAKGYKPAAAAPKAAAQTDKIDDLRKGLESSKSLSQISGRAPENLTLDYIANCPTDEFDKIAENWEKVMGKLMH